MEEKLNLVTIKSQRWLVDAFIGLMKQKSFIYVRNIYSILINYLSLQLQRFL